MSPVPPEHVLHDPLAQLERAFIEEFLRARGFDLSTLTRLPTAEADALWKEASLYASGKLTEVESRAHYVNDLHDAPPSPKSARGHSE